MILGFFVNHSLMSHLRSVALGTNLKVGGGRGHTSVVVSSTFFGSTSTTSSCGERFRDGQYSLVSFLFTVLLTVTHL